MVQILPPLPALRAFEAAARHLSFARAGGELRVTPGAISHQIKQLEEWVGSPLFKRKANRVVLTETGRILANRVNAIFGHIISAGAAARSAESKNVVHIRCQHSVAAKWLAPRINRFLDSNRGIAVTVQVGPHRWSAAEKVPDLSIYNARGSVPGYRETLLLSGQLGAVAAPSLIPTMPPILTPADLLSGPLIAVDFNEPGWHDQGWEAWFAAAGLGHTVPSISISFSLVHLAIEACIAGAGFALVPNFLVERELLDGDLVDVCGFALPNTQPYYLIEPDPKSGRDEVELLKNWLLEEAIAFSDQFPSNRQLKSR
ncbi:LysR substrate-binding domain-containing protein [Microvirga sp. VF16]|uniref:LysR substrate-binding domain-containing protein n=1 Tax=Microvirga sp. VF16 TaxID=2807101 RepID=UPI00193EB7A2|nr:LysR substrate-binding domain-containing protein [Microvirga sp. VF16]QRM33039.1 LysR family transcriptional regulator [Microvirga sp. VF16]